MKTFFVKHGNVGDTLASVLLENLTLHKAEPATTTDEGKLLIVGSFLELVCKNDVILGIGSNKPKFYLDSPEGVKYLSVRGPLTREHILNAEVPEIYGDPALLLPLIYNPKVEKYRKVGVIPHYIDRPLFEGEEIIDIENHWKTVVDEILSCERVVSSTLHGIVLAEAYGIPATWAVYSDKIEGGPFKYQDYFLGTGRSEQKAFTELPPIENLPEIQKRLVKLFNTL